MKQKTDKFISFLFFIAMQLFSFSAFSQKDFTSLVNPFIGTGGHGHTYPGASMPFGMMQLSPDTRLKGWDGCSGYHYSDSSIYGFSHTHLSGTGIEDYCDILLQPTTGQYLWINEDYKSSFSHQNEKASPGYYSVKLDKYNIGVELTATTRTGMHRYSFPKGTKQGNVLIDLLHRDIVLDSWLEQVDSVTLRGMRQSRSWANKQTLYFVIRFSKPFTSYTVSQDEKVKGAVQKVNGRNIKAIASFDLTDGSPLLVKVAISGVSVEGAMKNLESEQAGFDFDAIHSKAIKQWNTELGKIEIEGGTKDEQVNFYTALYHAFLNPNMYMDVDHQYRGTDDKIHTASGFNNYSVFSLWDTYRAYNPLMTIINPDRVKDWIKTFLHQYQNGGMLPVWELSANETFCMVGYHSVPVIVDAYEKGIRDFDAGLALKAMRSYAESDRFGLSWYRKNGYISNDKEAESVSKTLEYAYDDWCIAQFAKSLNNNDAYSIYIQRAQSYKNLFDPVSGHMRGKLGGIWYSPFDPREINHFFTEGNSWQYSFAAPQDISGLMNLYGGKKRFAKNLNELFTTVSKTTGRDQSDVTGLIGQYAQGNEPSHHMAYLFNYVSEPWQTQYYIHKICKEFYKNQPDGLIGNEDCGQMSAWYILSAMGFYQVCPGKTEYTIGTPLFDKITIHLEAGKKFIINANRKNKEDYYIQSAKLNNSALSKSWFTHTDLVAGGELNPELGDQPNRKWAVDDKDIPVSSITVNDITAVPYFDVTGKKFKRNMNVSIQSVSPRSELYYAIASSDSVKQKTFLKYSVPFTLFKKSTVFAYALQNGKKSQEISQTFFKIPDDKAIKILSVVNPLYTADGPEALIDGVEGEPNYRTGDWQSYEGKDFIAIIDLERTKSVQYLGAHFMQDVGSWIWMPTKVIYETSQDGESYTVIGEVQNTVSDKDYNPVAKEFGLKTKINTRYIKIRAINYGKIPDWHPGTGGDAHIFIDEIIVR